MAARSDAAPLRAVLALAVGVVGVFVTLIAGALAAEEGASGAFLVLLDAVLLAWVAGAAALALGPERGRGPLAASLAGPATPRWLAAGLAVGLGAYALNALYVAGLARLFESDAPPAEGPLALRLLGTALLAPPIEEWLCRGVLWNACRRATSRRGAVFATAAVFGVLHGLAGVLAVPHRFAFGLALGWLRARSGSLLPGVVAHALNNLLAVLVGGE